MRVEVNGEGMAPRAETLAELLEDCGFETASVATAVNGQFVPRGGRAAVKLTDGDRIEVLSPMQGG